MLKLFVRNAARAIPLRDLLRHRTRRTLRAGRHPRPSTSRALAITPMSAERATLKSAWRSQFPHEVAVVFLRGPHAVLRELRGKEGQLRALVPDFHVPPPPPPTEALKQHAAEEARVLHLA